jgi:hypothetical protein
MHRINHTWRDGRVEDLAPLLHAEIVMALPGFAGSTQGREPFLAGFRDFCEKATIQEFRDHDYQVDVAGETAVITFRFDMLYERSGKRHRSCGRDLWAFQKLEGAWIAVWRTLLDVKDELS